ncbi:MAG: radical SAM protein [Candidatus Zixiibacteriota bacterium]
MVSMGELFGIVFKSTPHLTVPSFLGTLTQGGDSFYVADHGGTKSDLAVSVLEIDASSVGPTWQTIPSVYLTALTNISRYRTRRYPLNVGRLAQWLRFQRAARVRATDLALDFGGRTNLLIQDILTTRPDALGISLNFGELASFNEFMSALRRTKLRPVICLGNVLAAWAQREVRELCHDFDCVISPSYGEDDLVQICRLLTAGRKTCLDDLRATSWMTNVRVCPTSIVVPDERLLRETLSQGGQVSIETSFGCQYGMCSFCPRDHRGKGWNRPALSDASEVVRRIGAMIAEVGDIEKGVLSIVDEDAFGADGRSPDVSPSIIQIIGAAGEIGIRCEIYTRLEQILDPKWSVDASVRRLCQLQEMCDHLTRVFVGVESGSNSQLRRFNKGQSVAEIVPALRAASLLGLPLEFGFITFDPLLTKSELVENIQFLGRTDVILSANKSLPPTEVYGIACEQGNQLKGNPVYGCVAYMATELELFATSRLAKLLQASAPHLLGNFDPNFARYGYVYQDPAIGRIAGICRIWTEGAFEPIYRIRVADRATSKMSGGYRDVISRYRKASYGLLVLLAMQEFREFRPQMQEFWHELCLDLPTFIGSEIGVDELSELWRWVCDCEAGKSIEQDLRFNIDYLRSRRVN